MRASTAGRSGRGELRSSLICGSWYNRGPDADGCVPTLSGTSINDMKDMLASLPQMREVKEKVRSQPFHLLVVSLTHVHLSYRFT